MPEIPVTEDQQERLESIRRDVEAAYVDTYGHARIEDAIEYLLDTYTPPEERTRAGAYDRIATAEYPELQHIASDVEGVPGSGIDADEMRGRLLSELGPQALARRLDTSDDSDASDDSDVSDDSDATTVGTEPDTESGTQTDERAHGESADTATATATGADETGDGTDDSSDTDTGGSLLASANKLLREHDDKWHESDGETPYEVELPDGSTEPARTKDDVRQLLFRHY